MKADRQQLSFRRGNKPGDENTVERNLRKRGQTFNPLDIYPTGFHSQDKPII